MGNKETKEPENEITKKSENIEEKDEIKEKNVEEEKFFSDWENDVWTIGNHHACGMFKETYEERCNELLARSNKYLNDNLDISLEKKVKIKCWQFWLVGFLSAQNFNVYEGNVVNSSL
jgi:hypothetical protein